MSVCFLPPTKSQARAKLVQNQTSLSISRKNKVKQTKMWHSTRELCGIKANPPWFWSWVWGFVDDPPVHTPGRPWGTQILSSSRPSPFPRTGVGQLPIEQEFHILTHIPVQIRLCRAEGRNTVLLREDSKQQHVRKEGRYRVLTLKGGKACILFCFMRRMALPDSRVLSDCR